MIHILTHVDTHAVLFGEKKRNRNTGPYSEAKIVVLKTRHEKKTTAGSWKLLATPESEPLNQNLHTGDVGSRTRLQSLAGRHMTDTNGSLPGLKDPATPASAHTATSSAAD